MHPVQSNSVLRRFFVGLTEYAFQTRLGVADPPLIDYLSDMLVRFVRCDRVYRLRDLAGRPLMQVAEMLAESDARIGGARREAHRHVGDFVLFWTGVYPEALRRMRGPQSKDQFVEYCACGKRSYYIASTIEGNRAEDEQAPRDVLERLSDEFTMCVQGLTEVRREWERGDGENHGPVSLLIR